MTSNVRTFTQLYLSLAYLLVLIFPSGLFGQIKSDTLSFQIYISKSNDKLQVECKNDCDCHQLSTSYKQDLPVYITNTRISHKSSDLQDTKSNADDFYFQLTCTQKEYLLTGIKGTNWTSLSFSGKIRQGVPQYGMTD